MRTPEPVTLRSSSVCLVPLSFDHVPDLVEAARDAAGQCPSRALKVLS